MDNETKKIYEVSIAEQDRAMEIAIELLNGKLVEEKRKVIIKNIGVDNLIKLGLILRGAIKWKNIKMKVVQ